MKAMFQSHIPHLKLLGRGKVRDIYEADDQHLLIVATDRLSAYDVIMPNPIPGKGEILTSLSNFWFEMMSDLVPNHLTKLKINSYINDEKEIKILEKRSIIVKKLKPLPIESVVRGYLIGSGWRDYKKNSAICGIKLPKNLNQAQKLPEIIYTPATKAAAGDHDVNINYKMTESLIGEELAKRVKEVSINIYERAFDYAISRGIIIADTKFEFGLDNEENLYLIDEILTPDSSRFWPKDSYKVGISPPSFDKQYLRDYLDTLSWKKVAPGPDLPGEIIKNTYQKYLEAKKILNN
ncbi:MAG: phosphoribosylaminoimidazolesuccinocarboxamide synthase [Woeseiaceae bacterium]|nr:phosphoribosylaminoimidazolesuccinocarboxamide synthase [Woeseiaceae bacterium]